MPIFTELPPEIITQICLLCTSHPESVANLSASCSTLRDIIIPDDYLWERLYVTFDWSVFLGSRQSVQDADISPTGLDNLRLCASATGTSGYQYNWRNELGKIVQLCRRSTFTPVSDSLPFDMGDLETLRNLVTYTQPDFTGSEQHSNNLLLGERIIARLPSLPTAKTLLGESEPITSASPGRLNTSPVTQAIAHLRTLAGVTKQVRTDKHVRALARSRLYDWRNFNWDTEFGPYCRESEDGELRVDWQLVNAAQVVIGWHATDEDEGNFGARMSLQHSRARLRMNHIQGQDWTSTIDLIGVWACGFCFCDHRQLLEVNAASTSPDEPLDPENFEFVKSTTIASPYPLYSTFRELYRTTIWKLTFVKIVRGDSSTKSAVHFAGTMLSPPEMSGVPLYGRVHEIEPNLLRWSFKCGQGMQTWSSEGIQVGGMNSRVGVLGVWTTDWHGQKDPLGPFWLHKIDKADEPVELVGADA